LDNNIPAINTEILNSPPKKQLTELRKYAIEQGVAPAQVDAYLLRQQWVSREVKQLIETPANQSEGQAGAESSSEGPHAAEKIPAGQQSNSEFVDSSTEKTGRQLEGSVELFNSKQEMERIKQEMSQEDRDTVENLKNREGASDRELTPNAEQTAEQKEQTSTSASQDNAAGVQKRLEIEKHVDGYSVSQQVVANREEIASSGDVSSARTWQAALMERLVNMWDSLNNMVTSQN
jgi:hypothetical protein